MMMMMMMMINYFVGWLTYEQRKPYFPGKLTIVTFQHGKVGIDPRSLKHQFALLPRHHGITSKSFGSFQGFNDESQQSY